MTNVFDPISLEKLFVPQHDSSKGQNGQVTIIGGSKLFHGAPLFSLVTASRMVDMVYFASPDPSIGEVANKIKSKLFSFIWVPWEETEKYIEKSDYLNRPGVYALS
jgi:NAD(P)H-hydrate repair Nnr-like enzyme with NAD(P)H-hydrate dehydratase domain